MPWPQCALILLTLSSLAACGVGMQEHGRQWPVDVSDAFLLDHASDEVIQTEEHHARRDERDFRPLQLPRRVDRLGYDTVLKLTLRGEDWPDAPLVLELPGQFLQTTVLWIDLADGSETTRQVTGKTRPFDSRPMTRAGNAFLVPPLPDGDNELLVADWGLAPHNFAAYLWSQEAWAQYTFNLRGWYGIFIGAILVLALYNAFVGVTIRDRAYLYYTGYVLSVLGVVVMYSDLVDEYLWRNAAPANYVLTVAGIAVFFSINFLNAFLDMGRRLPRLARLTQGFAWAALALAVVLGIDQAVPGRSDLTWLRAPAMHTVVALGSTYFLGVAIIAYLSGLRQARYLALSAVFLIAGVSCYMLQIYALVRYDHVMIHGLEFGVLAEGILLSLALADRISVMQREKDAAEAAVKAAERRYSRRLIESQEGDRETFSSALHDSIGHGLLVMKQDLRAAGERVATEGGRRELAELLEAQAASIDEVLEDVRSLSHDLHPHLLRRLGLAAAVESTFERAFASRNIDWYVEFRDPVPFDEAQELNLFRIVQESIANILKHAQASEVILTAGREGDGAWVMRIKDDGEGFAPAPERPDGIGLQSMTERARLFGGRLEVESTPGSGTELTIALPLSQA